MQRFSKILVGVPVPEIDESGEIKPDLPTQAAIKQAVELAKGVGAKITFLSVLDVPSGGFLSSAEKIEAALREPAEACLAKLLDEWTDVECEAQVVVGTPWEQICQIVMRDNISLVMAGTRNKGALTRFLFGGTGLRLLRNCPCPVWIVRPREEDDAELDVLVATQLDDVGQQMLQLAVEGSHSVPAKIHALSVVDLAFDRRMGLNREEFEEYRKKCKGEAEQQLQEQIMQTDYRTTEHGVQPHVIEGQPHTIILAAIEEFKIDLLIMGTAARGGLSGAILGNTAEHLLPEIPCSILAIKPDDFVCPIELPAAE